MITIGAIYGGPEQDGSLIDQRITSLMLATERLTRKVVFGSSPAINVVYHLSGSLYSPDFQGIRDATFSRKKQMLMVQVSVPVKTMRSKKSIDEFLLESLHEANSLAVRYFEKKGLAYAFASAERLAEKIGQKMRTSKKIEEMSRRALARTKKLLEFSNGCRAEDKDEAE